MIRAAFRLEYAYEGDTSVKRPEFDATHLLTQDRIAVEARSRHLEGVMGWPGVRDDAKAARVKVRRLIEEGLRKQCALPLVLFIDLNRIPTPSAADSNYLAEIQQEVEKATRLMARPHSFNMIAFTNVPFHYREGDIDLPEGNVTWFVSEYPRIPVRDQRTLDCIIKSISQFGRIPSAFDE